MPKRSPNALPIPRPAHKIFGKVLSRWTGFVLRCLSIQSPMRYSELQKSIGGISQKILTQKLRDLEEGGFVKRRVYPVIPPKVEYSLTDMGRSLADRVMTLENWIEGHITEIEAANKRYTQKSKTQGRQTV